MGIFLRKIFCVFLIFNHLWIFNYVLAFDLIQEDKKHRSRTSIGEIWMHPLIYDNERNAYSICFDENVKNLTNILYFYDVKTNSVLGRLEKNDSVFTLFFSGPSLMVHRTIPEYTLKIMASNEVHLCSGILSDLYVKAPKILCNNEIDNNFESTLIAHSISISRKFKGRKLLLDSVNGVNSGSILATESALISGNWVNHGVIATLGDLVCEGRAFTNAVNSKVLCNGAYYNSCNEQYDAGSIQTYLGSLIAATSYQLAASFHFLGESYVLTGESLHILDPPSESDSRVLIEIQEDFSAKFKSVKGFDGHRGQIQQNRNPERNRLILDSLTTCFGTFLQTPSQATLSSPIVSFLCEGNLFMNFDIHSGQGSIQMNADSIEIGGVLRHGNLPGNRTLLNAKTSVATFTNELGEYVNINAPKKEISADSHHTMRVHSLILNGEAGSSSTTTFINAVLECYFLSIHDTEVYLRGDFLSRDKDRLPKVDINGNNIRIFLHNFIADVVRLKAQQTCLLQWDRELSITNGHIQAGLLDPNSYLFLTACQNDELEGVAQLKSLEMSAPHKTIQGRVVVEDIKTHGKTLLLDGHIHASTISCTEDDAILTNALLSLDQMYAQSPVFISSGVSSVGSLKVAAHNFGYVNHMNAGATDFLLAAAATNDIPLFMIENSTFDTLKMQVLKGDILLSHVTSIKGKAIAKNMIGHHVKAKILDVDALRSISIDTLHIGEKASLKAKNSVTVTDTSGGDVKVKAETISVQSAGLQTLDAKAKTSATVSGNVDRATVHGNDIATFEGTSHHANITSNMLATLRVKDAGIEEAVVHSALSVVCGDAKFDRLSVAGTDVFIGEEGEQNHVSTFLPHDDLRVHTAGTISIGAIEPQGDKTFSLINTGILKIKQAALLVQDLLNTGEINFDHPSSIEVRNCFYQAGLLKGNGSLQVELPYEVDSLNIMVKALNPYLHRIPLKGRALIYEWGTEDAEEGETLFEDIISDYGRQSGFISLGIDQEQAVFLLLQNLENLQLKTIIASEIYRALLDKSDILPDDFYSAAEDAIDELSSLEEHHPRREKILKNIQGWCMENSVLQSYIVNVVGRGNFQLGQNLDSTTLNGTLDVLATLMGYSLEIFVTYPGTSVLRRIHLFNPVAHNFEGEFKVRKLLYLPSIKQGEGVNEHFNVLLTDDEWGERPSFLCADSLKGEAKLCLNRAHFTDHILFNPSLQSSGLIHYILRGDQKTQLKHHFTQPVKLDFSGHYELTSDLTAEQYLSIVAGSIDAHDFAIGGSKDIRVAATKGDLKTEKGKVLGKSLSLSAQRGSQAHHETLLRAEEDIDLRSKKDTILTSSAQRKVNRGSFVDEKSATALHAGGSVGINSGGNVVRQGVDIDAGKDISVLAGESIFEIPLVLERKLFQYIQNGTRTDNWVFNIVNHDTAGRKVFSHAGEKQEIYASEKKGTSVSVSGDDGVRVHTVQDMHSCTIEETQKRGGILNRGTKTTTTTSMDSKSKVSVFRSDEFNKIISEKADVYLQGVVFDSPLTTVHTPKGKQHFASGINESALSVMRQFSNYYWQSMKIRQETHTTYTPCSTTGHIESYAQDEVVVDIVKDHALDLLSKLTVKEGDLREHFLEEKHTYEEKCTGGPSAILSAIVVIALSIVTGGAAASLGGAVAGACGEVAVAATATTAATLTTTGAVISGLTAGAFMGLCSQAALCALNSNGSLNNAVKMLVSSDSLKSIALTAITYGVTDGYLQAKNIPVQVLNRSFAQNLQVAGLRATTHMVTRSALYQESPFKNFAKNALDCVVQSICAEMAKSVGGNRANLDYMSHKFLHAMIGAFGGVSNGVQGIASGAAGAMMAEIAVEALINIKDTVGKVHEKHPEISKDDVRAWKQAIRSETSFEQNLAKFIAAVGTGIFGANVDIAHRTATNAIENNWIMLAGVGELLFEIGAISYSAYRSWRMGTAAYGLFSAATDLEEGRESVFNEKGDSSSGSQNAGSSSTDQPSTGGGAMPPPEDPEDEGKFKENKLTEKQREQLKGKRLEGGNPGNVRENSQKGRLEVDSERLGGLEEAKRTFERLTGEKVPEHLNKPGDMHYKILPNGNRVQIRFEGRSGHPKIEIKDLVQKILEKVSFK